MNSLGYRYYTLEARPIPYKSPNLTAHPATARAKEAADALNESYLEVFNLHQNIKSKLSDFKRQVGQAEYSDLSTCFSCLNVLTGKVPLKLECSDSTNEPVKLIGGSDEVVDAVTLFNEVLDLCHEFLSERERSLRKIKEKIDQLRSLAVMQQILTICSTFETHAPENINIFATEIRSLLLDARSAAKLKLK